MSGSDFFLLTKAEVINPEITDKNANRANCHIPVSHAITKAITSAGNSMIIRTLWIFSNPQTKQNRPFQTVENGRFWERKLIADVAHDVLDSGVILEAIHRKVFSVT